MLTTKSICGASHGLAIRSRARSLAYDARIISRSISALVISTVWPEPQSSAGKLSLMPFCRFLLLTVSFKLECGQLILLRQCKMKASGMLPVCRHQRWDTPKVRYSMLSQNVKENRWTEYLRKFGVKCSTCHDNDPIAFQQQFLAVSPQIVIFDRVSYCEDF